MTDEPNPGANPNAPLDYQSPATAQPVSYWKLAGGIATAAAGLAVALPMALMFLGHLGWLLIAGVAAVLVILAVQLKRQPHWRSFAIGLWIGLGVTLLIEGICWVTLINALRHA